jgi:hypothetical protein
MSESEQDSSTSRLHSQRQREMCRKQSFLKMRIIDRGYNPQEFENFIVDTQNISLDQIDVNQFSMP